MFPRKRNNIHSHQCQGSLPLPCVQTSLYAETISMLSGLGTHSVRSVSRCAVKMRDEDPAEDKTFSRWSWHVHVPLTVQFSYIKTI